MERVWRTYDGCIFTDEFDAVKHEEEIKAQVGMWTLEGEPTEDTSQAMILHLVGPEAASIFLAMAETNPEETDLTTKGIDEDCEGWFYWNEGYDEYCWIDDDFVFALLKISKWD